MSLDEPTETSDDEPEAESPPSAATAEEWVLQADAAVIAGCSVSAIRKWRREGVVSDRRTTTIGGLERVEVRLEDVLERCGRREAQSQPQRPSSPPAASEGTVFLPLADLQALILNLGEAERRALEATNRATAVDGEVQQLTEALSRAEAGLAAARSELDTQRRRVREMETGTGITASGHPGRVASENERLREHVARLEARMAESRSEVDGQRRRIRELESRLAAPSESEVAAEAEMARLREQNTRLETRLGTARSELEGQRRRIRDLEARVATPSEGAVAVEAENEGLRRQVGRLEARLAESGAELEAQRRSIRELETRLAAPSERALAAEAENASLREHVGRLEAHLAEKGAELEAQRRGIRELETRLAAPSDRELAAEVENEGLRRQVGRLQARLAETAAEVDAERRGIGEREARPVEPAEVTGNGAVSSSAPPGVVPTPSPRGQPVGAPRNTKTAFQRLRQRLPDIGDRHRTAARPRPEPTATELRRLYRRLQARRRDESTSPAENRRWIADLAAYDEALVLACGEFGVPTNFEPGDRLPADERVRLTRDLGAAGLDVREQAVS